MKKKTYFDVPRIPPNIVIHLEDIYDDIDNYFKTYVNSINDLSYERHRYEIENYWYDVLTDYSNFESVMTNTQYQLLKDIVTFLEKLYKIILEKIKMYLYVGYNYIAFTIFNGHTKGYIIVKGGAI